MTKYFFCRFSEKKKSFLVDEFALAEQCSFSFLLFVCVFIFFVCPSQKGSNSQDFPQVARQLFSNFWYLEQLFNFVSCNVLHSEQFLSFSSNSQISKQPLELKLAFLKKRPDPPPRDRSWTQDACSRAARSTVFKRNGGRSLSPVKQDIQQVYWFILEFLQD